MQKITQHLFILICFFFYVKSQNFSWKTKTLYQTVAESGQYPSLVVDSSGIWHIFYWHPDENRFYHSMLSSLLESPVWHLVDSLENGGYPHKVYLARNGKLYVAYMVEQGGEMALRLAEWDGTRWQIDRNITSQTFGPYGPYQRFVFPYTQPSIAIGETSTDSLFLVVFQTKPVSYNPTAGCYYFSPPLEFVKIGVSWVSFPISGTFTTFSGSQCGQERYGELITFLPSLDNVAQLYCIAQRNGELWRFSSNGSATSWQRDSLPLDSLTHYFVGISNTLREVMTFDGLSLMRTPDSVTHLFYSTSDYYGANLGGSGKWGLIHLRITPTDSFIYSYIHTFGSLHYSNTSCAYYNEDTFYVTYTVPALGQYRIATTYDGGQSWNIDTLYTTTSAVMNAPIQIKKDTIAILCYDSKYDRLLLFWQLVGDTVWNFKALTTSSRPGYYLSAGWSRWDSLNRVYHIAYFDISKHYLIFQTWDNDSLVNEWQLDDTTKTYSEIDVFAKDTQICFVYVDDVTNRIKLSRMNGGIWSTEIVDFSVPGVSPQVAIDSSLNYHVVFTDIVNGILRYAMKGKIGGWNYQNLDTSGVLTGLYPQLLVDSKDTLHILYAQMDSNALYYIRGKGNFWKRERVGDSLSASFVFSFSLYYDQPYIVFKGKNNNILYYAWKDTVTNTWNREPISFLPQGNITNRIWLRFDSYGHPWVLYAYQNILSGIGLVTRLDSFWTSIPIPNPKQIGEDVWFDIPNGYLVCIGRSSISPAIALIYSEDTIPSTSTFIESYAKSVSKPEVFPNPFSDQIHIRLRESEQEVKVFLYTIKGEKIPCQVYESEYGEYIVFVNEGLSEGYYFLVITSRKRQWVIKVFKQ